VATPLVGGAGGSMSIRLGREFFKMTGSGNDFIFFDARVQAPRELAAPEVIRELCARGTGIGADGVVFIEPSTTADFGITYLNSDGTRAALCGNASLCTTSLAVDLGMGPAGGLAFETDAGVIAGRIRGKLPEIDLQPVRHVDSGVDIPLDAGELRIGFAEAGVPHVVVLCRDVDQIELGVRGRSLRWNTRFPQGANANFVSRGSSGNWRMRTYERGVEGETLACGTGAVATALLLGAWGEAGTDVELESRSGRIVGVRSHRERSELHASLRGEGRLVYQGALSREWSGSGAATQPRRSHGANRLGTTPKSL
jgi:diaminopimelate epimerase